MRIENAPGRRMIPLLLCGLWLATSCGTSQPPQDATDQLGAGDDDGSATSDEVSAQDAQPDAALGDSQEKVCVAGVVNDHGVGKPCSKPEDCFGQLAVTCADNVGPGAPKMCIEYCFGFPGECEGSVCMQRGTLASICVPADCAALYNVPPPDGINCTEECTAGPTAFGVGKPCTTHEECSGQIAKSCPFVLKPTNQKWCSLLCIDDADCGPGALCWRQMVEDFGVILAVGSCAAAECCELP